MTDAAWRSAEEQIRAYNEVKKETGGQAPSAGPVGGSNTRKERYKVVDSRGKTLMTDVSYGEAGNFIASNGRQDDWEIKRYSKGGLISEKSSGSLDEIARAVKEDHLVAVSNNERVLTSEQNKRFEELLGIAPSHINVTPNINIPKFDATDINERIHEHSRSVSFNTRDIHLHEVQNVDGFAEAIRTRFPLAMLQEYYAK